MNINEDLNIVETDNDQTIAKYIFDISKEMRIESTHGVIGNELELITLVRNCRFLYDKNLSAFKDVQKKNVAWSAIARVMNSRVSDVQQRWRSLREGYNKYKKEMEMGEEINNGSIRPWEFYEDMKFIEPYIVHRRTAFSRTSNKHLMTDDEYFKNENLNDERNPDVMNLISCIKLRPVLYDNKHVHYKSREHKIKCWDEVAQTMGVSASECEMKWKNLRERYGRERKLKNISAERRSWEYFDVLCFLDNHIKPRRHSIFRPILPKPEENTNVTIYNSLLPQITDNNQTIILKQIIKDLPEAIHDNSEASQMRINSNFDMDQVEFVEADNMSTSRSVTVSPEVNESKITLKDSYMSSSEHSQVSHDEDELFGQTITAELRRLPSGKKKMKIKAEIFKILYENESDY